VTTLMIGITDSFDKTVANMETVAAQV